MNILIKACEKAYATEFVKEKGLDFVVGIKGSKLSGGQKQRVAIARAILTKPKLLILDEATSALDNKSEIEVQKALDIVSQGVTTVIIAHKIDTIKNSDNIICLEKGKVVETGKHEELLARGHHYSNLVQSQGEKERKQKQKQMERMKEELSRLSLSQHIDHNDISLEEIQEHDEENHNSNEDDENYEHPENKPMSKSNIILGPLKKEYLGTESEHKNEMNIKLSDMKDKVSPAVLKKASIDRAASRKVSRVSSSSIVMMEKKNPVNILWQKKIDEIVDDRITKFNKKERFKSLRIRLMMMLKDDKLFLIGGAIAASCNGAIWPIYGILLADAIGALADPVMEEVSRGGLNVAMMFLALAIIAAVILWMQKYFIII